MAEKTYPAIHESFQRFIGCGMQWCISAWFGRVNILYRNGICCPGTEWAVYIVIWCKGLHMLL